MCIPKPQQPAPLPTTSPSIPAATSLQLGAARGPADAANLGRLRLRTPAPVAPVEGSQAATVASSGQPGTPGATAVPNTQLRFGIPG